MRENELSSKTEVRKKRGERLTRGAKVRVIPLQILLLFSQKKKGKRVGGAAVKTSPLSARVRRRPDRP